MDGPYRLINCIHAHEGAVRSLSIGPNGVVVSGCQANSPNVRRWILANSSGTLDVSEVGTPLYHDHWITACTSLKADPNRSFMPEGCLVTGCMDSKIRMFNPTGDLVGTLLGHGKGIISLSWSIIGQLLSGSWDGTAKVWDISSMTCIHSLGPHENGVQVLGLTSNQIATVSTGESVNGKPANFRLRFWDGNTGAMIGTPIEDHIGPIRGIAALPGIEGFATCSNDGSVKLRSIEGQEIGTMLHPPQEDGTSPFVLNCCALDTNGGMDLVSCGEDGSFMVWQGTEQIQAIPHPSCVWCAVALPGTNGDFVTGCNDGVLRIFSRNPDHWNNNALAQSMHQEFLLEVDAAQSKRHRGPSQEELAKAPLWDLRGQNPGTSENQVSVFNKDGNMIAAQWTSGSWVIIGEVTGTGDGGNINGVWFDHVMPVEMDTPNGLMKLQLGYNNNENPFVAAQRFIDANQLGQQYLQEIADWIVARAGKSTPTLGMDSGTSSGNSVGASSSYSAPSASARTFTHKINTYVVFDDIPPAKTKLMAKLTEFNNSNNANDGLNEVEMSMLDAMVTTLCNSSQYHASTLSNQQLLVLVKMCSWPASQLFPLFDLLRLVAVHPAGAETLAKCSRLNTLLECSFQLLSQIPNSPELPAPTALTSSRFLVNLFRHDDLRKGVSNQTNLLHQMVVVVQQQLRNNNKQVRVALVSVLLNTAYFLSLHNIPACPALFLASNSHLLEQLVIVLTDTAVAFIQHEQENADVVYRCLISLGMLLANSTSTSNVMALTCSQQLQILQYRTVFDNVMTLWTAARVGDASVTCMKEIQAFVQAIN